MRYVIESLTTPTCLLSAGIILFLVFLIIYHAILKKNNRPIGLWRVLCVVPCLVMYTFPQETKNLSIILLQKHTIE